MPLSLKLQLQLTGRAVVSGIPSQTVNMWSFNQELAPAKRLYYFSRASFPYQKWSAWRIMEPLIDKNTIGKCSRLQITYTLQTFGAKVYTTWPTCLGFLNIDLSNCCTCLSISLFSGADVWSALDVCSARAEWDLVGSTLWTSLLFCGEKSREL